MRQRGDASGRVTAGQRSQQDAPDIGRVLWPPTDEGIRVRVIDRLAVGVFDVAVVVISIKVQADEDSYADANTFSQAA